MAQLFAGLPEDELRRRAMVAARDQDRDTLWDLTVAHFTTLGRQGAQLSSRTLKIDRIGVMPWLDYSGDRAGAIPPLARELRLALRPHPGSPGPGRLQRAR